MKKKYTKKNIVKPLWTRPIFTPISTKRHFAISFWKKKKKLFLEMFILILENEKSYPKLSIVV